MNFNKFLKLISKIEEAPLPGEQAHFKMVPPFRQDLIKQQGNAIKKAKKAGVLVLFYPDKNNETYFILMLRKTYKGVHSAQVSLPGGKYEPEDQNIKATALRETFEEVGVPIKMIKVVKTLSQVYIPPSNFYVQPFAGICKIKPDFIKEDAEVEALIEVPLKDLLDDKTLIDKWVETSYSAGVEVPAFQLNGFTVWGATAMMLSEIKDIISETLF